MARIMIIGAGVVGGATGAGFVRHGNDVTFVDIDQRRIDQLTEQGSRAVTPNDIDLNKVDAVFVSVTALTGENGIDLTYLLEATRNLGNKLAAVTDGYPVIVFRCTLPPGTVRNTLTPLLEDMSGRKAGTDFGVVYNPEFLRAATAEQDFMNPRAIVLASFDERDRAHVIIRDIMLSFGAPIHWVSLEEAELLKYINNVFNAVKISFFNFVRLVAAEVGVDPTNAFNLSTETAEGLWNPTYGTRNHGAFGGVCLPKDTEALRHFAEALGVDVSLLAAVQRINDIIAERA